MATNNQTPKKGGTFGTCSYERTSPPKEELAAGKQVINLVIKFEEALKLNLAIDECIRQLNEYNRKYKSGKDAALQISIHFDKNKVMVSEGKL